MRATKVLLAGGLVVGCAVAGFTALGGSMVRDLPYTQVPKSKSLVQVYGSLDKKSIRPIRGANQVAFELVEEKTGDRLSVVYYNPSTALPANFPTASHARALGVYDPVQGKLVADRVLTKCPSKYEEKDLDMATRKAVEKWQASTGLKATGS